MRFTRKRTDKRGGPLPGPSRTRFGWFLGSRVGFRVAAPWAVCGARAARPSPRGARRGGVCRPAVSEGRRDLGTPLGFSSKHTKMPPPAAKNESNPTLRYSPRSHEHRVVFIRGTRNVGPGGVRPVGRPVRGCGGGGAWDCPSLWRGDCPRVLQQNCGPRC